MTRSTATSLLALAALATAMSTFMACGGATTAPSTGDDAAKTATEGGPADALVIAWQSDLGNLNPTVSETAADSAVMGNIYMPELKSGFDCSLEHKPGLYKSWTWSEDHLTITYQLRDDITWSDGKPVTAHDIVFAYELVGDDKVASPRRSYVEHFAEGYPQATGDYEVVFKFDHAFDEKTMMSETALGHVPKHKLLDADRTTLRGNDISLHPLVDGPFKLSAHEANTRIVLEPNEAFTGPEALKPNLKRVVFRILPEYSTRLVELENGGVDMMEGINIEDIDRLKSTHPEIKFYSRGYRFSDYVAWNIANPLFADREVRRALTMAIDIDGMMDKLLTGKDGKVYAKKSVGTITPELCAYHADEIPVLSFDAAAAAAILASKGWTDTNGDGILDKDGKKFSFTLATNSGNKRRSDASIFIQANLKTIGVEVNLEQLESNTFFENLRTREYEAALAGWSAALFVDPSDVWKCDRPDAPSSFNFTGYCNPDVDKLIDQGLHTPSEADQVPIWKAVQAQIYDDQPYTFLWWREEFVGLHERFEHVGMDVLSLLTDLEQWDVPADKVKYKR